MDISVSCDAIVTSFKAPASIRYYRGQKKKFIYFIALLLMSRRASLPFTPAPTENLPSDNDSMVPQLHHYYSSHPQLPQINGISRSLFPYYSFERKSSPLAQSILSKRHPANRAFIGLQWTPSSPTLNNCGFYPIAQRFISLPVRCSYVTNRYYHDNPQILPPKKYNFRRSAKSDLAHRFQKNSDYSNESTPSRGEIFLYKYLHIWKFFIYSISKWWK